MDLVDQEPQNEREKRQPEVSFGPVSRRFAEEHGLTRMIGTSGPAAWYVRARKPRADSPGGHHADQEAGEDKQMDQSEVHRTYRHPREED